MSAQDLIARVDPTEVDWDLEADVVVVGSGAAGWSAAFAAASHGARVVVLEKESLVGGTTARAGGGEVERASTWLWICDHDGLADLGLADPRPDALRYMTRLARPEAYDPSSPTLGATAREHAQIAAFYDHGKHIVRALRELGGLDLRALPETWDYYPDLPENSCPRGRTLALWLPDGRQGTGADIVTGLQAAAERSGVEVRTSAPVRGLLVDPDDERAVGVLAGRRAADSRLVRARAGVIFASGGFTRDPALLRAHLRGPVLGGLASAGNDGDLVRIAAALGAPTGAMNEAWYTPMVLDHAPYPTSGAFRLPGDSMILVNLDGERVVNEKTTYNEMTRAFFTWDPAAARYPNIPLVMVFDESVSQRCRDMPEDAPVTEGGGNPIPRAGHPEPHELVADDLPGLAGKLHDHLARHAALLPGVTVAPHFADRLAATIQDFGRIADDGVDVRFGRGGTRGERARSGAARRPGMVNPTMHRFAPTGPYHAIVLVPGTLDTKGGPLTDERARILGSEGTPIPGLYGAGNCVASPAGQGYWGGGTTLGLAVTFGWLAGRDAAGRRSARSAAA